MQATRLPLQLKIRDTDRYLLGKMRRSVSEKAPLQNQFSERMCTRRTRVERQGHLRVTQKRNENKLFKAEIHIRKFGVIARPTFPFRKNNRPQNLAALYVRGLLLLLRRLGMKRALRGIGIMPMNGCGLAPPVTRRQRSEHTMIRDREPGTDCNRNACATHARIHHSDNS
jgi:hypothetical protein